MGHRISIRIDNRVRSRYRLIKGEKMSIGFQLFKTSKGWRLTDEFGFDLTHWSIDYDKDRIVCRPTPIDLIYSIFGAVFFFAFSGSILAMVFYPAWFFGPSMGLLSPSSSDCRLLANVGFVFPMIPANQKQGSKYQQDPASIEEIRRVTKSLKEKMMEGMNEEERAEFIQSMSRINKSPSSPPPSKQMDKILDVLFVVGKVICVLVALVSGLIGLACLRRVLLFFRNKLEVRVSNQSLLLSRPKLFGQDSEQSYAIHDLVGICCRPIVRQGLDDGFDELPYVVWTVQIVTRSKDSFPLEFKVEHSVMASARRPTAKTKKFAKRLSRMTGLPMLE